MIEFCRRTLPRHAGWLALVLLAWTASGAAAQDAQQPANTLQSVDYSVLPGNRLEIRFQLDGPVQDPRSFTIREPARIALDFPGTRNATGERRIPLGIGVAESLNIAEAQGRTRVVLNLSEIPQHRTRVENSTVILSLGDSSIPTQTATGADEAAPGAAATDASVPSAGSNTGEPFQADQASGNQGGVRDVAFRRGEEGQGRVIIELAGPDVPINIEREGNAVVVDMAGTTIPRDMRRRLDVLDFATPVKFVDIMQRGERGRVRIIPRTDDYEQLAYQSGNRVTVELKPLTEEEVAEREQQKPQYTGEKLSLNFQDIEVRSVLQLLADFTGLNVVVSDSVQGSLTLRLKNVPWDQALDIILQSEGLGKRRNGNVIFVAPQQEIAAREQAKLEAEQKEQELAPLRTEYVQINYAKAGELATILQSEGSNLLSERASVTVDQRTNTLLLRATGENLEEARRLVSRLDVPVRQVLIESRIVIATDDFNRELGVRFGVQRDTTNDGEGTVISDSGTNVDNLIDNDPVSGDRYNVNLPVTNPAGSVALALAKLPFGTLLELELSALQAEGRGEIISTPRVITANQKEALIEQGVEVPFQEASSSGATSVSFKKAVLSLGVTPQITPDDRIIMDLQVTNDTVGEVFAGVPSIDTREVQTQVLVDNGETVVLGGIYEQSKNRQVNRVPFFSNLPVVGNLFKSTIQENDQSELLVFVTPRIVKGGTGVEY